MSVNYNKPELTFDLLKTDSVDFSATHITLEKYGLVVYMLVPSDSLAASWPVKVVFYFILWSLSIALILTLLLRLF